MTDRPKNTPRPKPAASAIPTEEELKKVNTGKVFIAGQPELTNWLNTAFHKRDFEDLSIGELWRQLGIAVCDLDHCEGLQPPNDPDTVAETKKRLADELRWRGIGQQAIDEYCAKALSEKKEADLRTVPTANDGPFSHSPDYRSVTIRGVKYALTSQQAQMIEVLHKAHANGNPDVSIASILERLEKKSSRWQDTFRSNPKAKKALVTTVCKGSLRLKL